MAISDFDNGEKIQYRVGRYLTVLFCILGAIWILFCLLFLFVACPCSKEVKQRLSNNETRFASLYGELNYEDNPIVKLYPFIFMGKRILFVVCVFYIDLATISILLCFGAATGNIVFVMHFRPF